MRWSYGSERELLDGEGAGGGRLSFERERKLGEREGA